MSRSISFVIPCLNEEHTLPYVLQKFQTLARKELADRNVEVVVSDNGSQDKSIQIAEGFGVKVVRCLEKGYGAALNCGIAEASGDIIVFADADNTYDFLDAPKLIHELEKGFDLVIGSRITGSIKPGAMPLLHRYLGTPVLNLLINVLYSRRQNKIRDCNSGFRCFRKVSFERWGIKGSGMEFASEMLIKAMINDAAISHVPITLYPDMRTDRIPHLKTWRDGMRHLLQILLYAPRFFRNLGLLSFGVSWTVLLVSFFTGPLLLGAVSILGMHTMMFAMLGSFIGIFMWSLGLFLSVRENPDALADYHYLLNLREDKLFFYSIAMLLIGASAFVFIIFQWSQNSFAYLALEKQTLLLISLIANNIFLVTNIIAAHLLKRV